MLLKPSPIVIGRSSIAICQNLKTERHSSAGDADEMGDKNRLKETDLLF